MSPPREGKPANEEEYDESEESSKRAQAAAGLEESIVEPSAAPVPYSGYQPSTAFLQSLESCSSLQPQQQQQQRQVQVVAAAVRLRKYSRKYFFLADRSPILSGHAGKHGWRMSCQGARNWARTAQQT